MPLYQQFKATPGAENDGVWVEQEANTDGSVPKFLLARWAAVNRRFSKTVEEVTKPYERKISNNKITTEESRKLNRAILLKAVLLNWENVQDEKDQPMEFSYANAEKLLMDLPELQDTLVRKAQDFATFRAQDLEEEAKNS